MARTVAIGIQSFDKIREGNYFYVDKTAFIKEWWESGDDVTLITRPRRFGKTLNMSMVEMFFSVDYADRGDLFDGLSIWQEEKYRRLQGTYPVISLSFANIKETNYTTARKKIFEMLAELYTDHRFLLDSGKLIREGSKNLKSSFEALLAGEHYNTTLDEQIVYDQLDGSEQAVWSLLLASGYLRVAGVTEYAHDGSAEPVYELELTNQEVIYMFQRMIRSWFHMTGSDYNDFVKALLLGDVDAMNEYMNRVARDTFSFFDTKSKVSARTEPERFYHGFVLGLIVELQGKYVITSNRESGFGRYDIMLDPVSAWDDAMIIEFKVRNPRREKSIEETLENALLQIEEKDYAAAFLAKGIPPERIRRYGFAFEGKNVLIG